jgi:uncharacterized protein YecE (DUF72 family)
MSAILVGTASWADKSLVDSGLFYPKQARTAEARLRHYATNFGLVEVDSSYYAMPAPQVTQLWAERTPDSFVFDIKAFRIFTQHQTPPKVLPPDIRQALGPLAEKKNVYYADFPPEFMDEERSKREYPIASQSSSRNRTSIEQGVEIMTLLNPKRRAESRRVLGGRDRSKTLSRSL